MLTRRVPILLLLMFITLCSCKRTIEIPQYLENLENLTVYPSGTNNEIPIELHKEIVFGDTGSVLLGRVADTAVDDNGSVFIGDWDATTIRVFDKDGSYLSDIGREGSGPGEFRSIYYMKIAEGMLYVYDFNLQRMSIFSSETHELQSILSMQFENEQESDLSILTADSFHLVENGNYVIQFVPGLMETEDDQRNQHLYIVSGEGRIISDLILEVPWGREFLTDKSISRVIIVPYARRKLINVADNSIYTLWTEDLAIKKYDLDGIYRRSFYHSVQKIELTRQEILSQEEFDDPHSRQMIRNNTLPNTWPAVQDFRMDDENQFWVSIHHRDQELKEWWVLKENGELISRFTWPEDRQIRYVKNGSVYTLEPNEVTGFEQVVKYRISFDKSP